MRVLYVCGYGRSGSTLLGRLLSSQHTAVAVGEVTHVASDVFLDRARCSCGQPYPRCAYWGGVHQRLTALNDAGGAGIRVSNTHRRLLEGLPGLLVPAALLRRLSHRCAFSERFPAVSFAQGARVLAEQAGTPIVDISKTTRTTANRPRLLRACGAEMDLYLAWRPVREVVASHRSAQRRRGRPGSVWRSAAAVVAGRTLAALSARWCARSVGSALPRVTLADITAAATPTPKDPCSLDHAIAGNRSRHAPIERGVPG
jgi:hypothetical protein